MQFSNLDKLEKIYVFHSCILSIYKKAILKKSLIERVHWGY